MLKGVKLTAEIEVELQGEALFNDGVGVVAQTVLHEVGDGLLLGIVAGYVAYLAMRAIGDFPVETLITLVLVSGM